MPDLLWRSSAAQVFVAGRIPKIDSYWAAHRSTMALYYCIDCFDLWDLAFPGLTLLNPKTMWKQFAGKLGKDPRLVADFGKKYADLGSLLTTALERNVTQPLQKLIQETPLTINFHAISWFGDREGFASYVTMWDRQQDDKALNAAPDPANPPRWRAQADRAALYGQFGKDDVKASGLQLPNVKATKLPSGDYAYKHSRLPADSQVYAALNYGRRPHGSTYQYGKSFFELNDYMKMAAIFLPMDTFTPMMDPVYTGKTKYNDAMKYVGFEKSDRGKSFQVSMNSFGGAILLAIQSQLDSMGLAAPSTSPWKNAKALMTDLLLSKRGNPLPDTKENHLIIEGHLFSQIKMTPDYVTRVCVSLDAAGQKNADIKTNAAAFAKKTGIALEFID